MCHLVSQAKNAEQHYQALSNNEQDHESVKMNGTVHQEFLCFGFKNLVNYNKESKVSSRLTAQS